MATSDADKVVAAINELMFQVCRVAWALEVPFLAPEGASFRSAPCSRCGTQLVPVVTEVCPACLAPQKDEINGGH